MFYNMGQGVAAGPTQGFGAAFGKSIKGRRGRTEVTPSFSSFSAPSKSAIYRQKGHTAPSLS